MSIQTLEAVTGMKSGRKKTHRGHRGGKTHGKPSHAKPKAPAEAPPSALAALLASAQGGATPPDVGVDPNALAMAGAPPQSGGSDPAVSHLIAALSALHGQGAPQGPPPQVG